MLWLALHFPRLGLEVWQPAWHGSADRAGEADDAPAVLLEDNRVALCNGAALAAGILPGCSLATAHSIRPGLAHFHRDADREERRLRFLAETVYRFSAQVSLEAPDALLLEIGASLALFGDAGALARQVQRLVGELGHETRRAIAATPGAALAMARAGVRRLEDVPVSCACIPAAGKHVERLANMGLHTLGPLLELPALELGRRFGPGLTEFLARLTGRSPDPRRCIEPAARFDQALHLLEPVRDKEALLFPMQRLLSDLSHWLVAWQLGAEQLVWSFSTHSEADRVAMPLRFARAQQSRAAFLHVIRLRLEQTELPEDILDIRLEATRLVPWLGGAGSLFAQLGPACEGALESGSSELIDQLRARLGDGACSGLAARDQHAPESAWTIIRPGTHPARRGAAPALPRPLWLFDPPHPADRARLTLLKGPERLQTAWWRETVWRDYYVAGLENGATGWAFVDARNQWFLHGYFG